MIADLGDGLIGEEEADGEVSKGCDLERSGVADDEGSGGNDDGGEVMALPSPRRAMEAASMVRGSTPNSLVRTTRTAGPPMEMWTISRRVTPVVSSALSLPLEFFSA